MKRENRKRVIIKSIFMVCPFFLFQSCSIGNFGTLYWKSTLTETAEVVDVYSLGVELRGIRQDSGATLGYRRTSYVYERAHEGEGESEKRGGANFFMVPVRQQRLVKVATTMIGSEVRFWGNNTGFEVGYNRRNATYVSLERSEILIIKYIRDRPENTVVEIFTTDDEPQQ